MARSRMLRQLPEDQGFGTCTAFIGCMVAVAKLAQAQRHGEDTVGERTDSRGRVALVEAHGKGKREMKRKRYLD